MTAPRRIVTGHDSAGVSCVIGDHALEGAPMIELWRTDGADRFGGEPDGAFALEPAAGGSCWRIVEVPPDAVTRAYFQRGVPGHDADGFHRTDTVDYVFILEGEITLELDRGAVALSAGDCVVQRGTRHAWRNHGPGTVRMLCAMLSAAPASAAIQPERDGASRHGEQQ